MLFVVEQDAAGKTISTRALRLLDGRTVPVPDFSAHLDKKRQIVGRRLLLVESAAKTALTLRLYDILTGADVWKQTYRGGSIVLDSEDPNFTGVVEPDGQVHIVDLRTHREALTGRMADPTRDLQKVETIHLLADAKLFYLTCHAPSNVGEAQSNLALDIGLRDLPVNGMIYTFERNTGSLYWYAPARNQRLVLDQFRELPVVLLTARYEQTARFRDGDYRLVETTSTMSIEKRSGKVIFFLDDLQTSSRFHTVRRDPATGTIDFTSPTFKVTHGWADAK